VLQHLWGLRSLQNPILTQAQETFEKKLADREPDDEFFPREQWPVQEPGEALMDKAVSNYSTPYNRS